VTAPYNQDDSSYVLPGGQIMLTVLFETWLGSGLELGVSDVQVTIAPVTGGAAVVRPTSDVTTIDEATYSYQWLPPQSTPAGDYLVTWQGNGPDSPPPITITQVTTVVPLPAETPSPGLYATVAQYRSRENDQLTPDDLVSYHLQLASEVIDEALIGAVYPTDADGMPTVASHIAVFGRACCAQVAFQLVTGDPQNVKPQFASTSMAGVSLTRSASAQGGAMPRLAPRAGIILHAAGVLGTAPLVNW
jgi:hypothetical protein